MAAKDAVPLLKWDAGSFVYSIATSPDSTLVVSGSDDNLVRIWDMHTGALVLDPLEGHTSWAGPVALPQEIRPFVSESESNTIRGWNTGYVHHSVAFSHVSSRVISGSSDNTIRIWDVHTGIPIGKPLTGHTDWVYSVAFSPDSTRITSGSSDHTIRIWDARTGDLIGNQLLGHTGAVYAVDFSPDGTCIVSSSRDNTIRLWDAHTGAPIGKPLQDQSEPVLSVTFAPDSTRIASGSADCSICIWDARTGIPATKPLIGHTDGVLSVAFSHDGTRIVSGSYDKTIRVWDARTGAPIYQPLKEHTEAVLSVTFSSESTRIISGSWDRTICVWEAPQSSPLIDMVTSNMSVEEMFGCLVKHGCTDLSLSLDPNQCSSQLITKGGFGDVWRVTLINNLVLAVKTLRVSKLLAKDVKAAKRATREVYHWSKLQHPNVQELLGIVIFQGGLGMVSPWLQEGHLQHYLSKRPNVPRYPLCIQLAAGVSYLHSVKMVHGDLKSTNVLVADDGTIKITDFDYAVLSDTTLHFSTTSRQGGGTLRWMAPELFQPERTNDEGIPEFSASRTKETDIYALGMTILEIITGNVPYFEYRNDMGIYRAIYKRKPPKKPKQILLPEPQITPVWEVLMSCWQQDPSVRPDATSVLALLNSMVV